MMILIPYIFIMLWSFACAVMWIVLNWLMQQQKLIRGLQGGVQNEAGDGVKEVKYLWGKHCASSTGHAFAHSSLQKELLNNWYVARTSWGHSGDKLKSLPSRGLHLEEQAKTNRHIMTGSKSGRLAQVNPTAKQALCSPFCGRRFRNAQRLRCSGSHSPNLKYVNLNSEAELFWASCL